MAISRRARFIRWLTGVYIRSLNLRTLVVAKARRRFEFVGRWFLIRAFGVKVERSHIAGVDVDWLRPKRASSDKVMLYIHGGAYIIGSRRTHRQLASHIARAAGIVAVLPEYRLAPEHPFPDGLDDAVAVYRGLLDAGYRPENIVISGDSAGGGLSAATLLALRQEGVAMPAAAVLLSPFLDVTGSGESAKTRAGQDPWFDPADLEAVTKHYCPDENLWHNPLVSPVFGDVAGLPPMLIQVGDAEILLSDSTRFADKLTAQGIDVELQVWPHMWHVFQMFIGKMPESKAAVLKIADYLRERFSLD